MILLNRGWEKTGPAHSSPLYYFLTFLVISQSLGLTYSWTVSEHSWLSCPKEKFKFWKHLANCMFLLNSGMGKDWAGPFFLPLYWVLTFQFICQSIYCLVFRFMWLFDCIWTILNDLFQRDIKFLNQQVNWYFYIVGWGKTWPAHSFPPPKCWDLSIYHLDFWIKLFFCCIWTLLSYTKQRIKFSNQQVHS